MTAHPAESSRARWLATRLIRCYPRPWRIRYGREMGVLIDDMPVAWRQVADLAVGAVREWISPRAFGWPARSAAARIQTVRFVKFLSWAVAIEVVAHVGARWAPAGGLTLPALDNAAEAVAIAGIARIVLGGLSVLRPFRVLPSAWSRIGSLEVVLWYAGWAVVIVNRHLSPIPAYVTNPGLDEFMNHMSVWMWAFSVYQFSSRTRRLRRIVKAETRRAARNGFG